MSTVVANLISFFMYGGQIKSAESVMQRIYRGDDLLRFKELENTNLGIYTYHKTNSEVKVSVHFFKCSNNLLYVV